MLIISDSVESSVEEGDPMGSLDSLPHLNDTYSKNYPSVGQAINHEIHSAWFEITASGCSIYCSEYYCILESDQEAVTWLFWLFWLPLRLRVMWLHVIGLTLLMFRKFGVLWTVLNRAVYLLIPGNFHKLQV